MLKRAVIVCGIVMLLVSCNNSIEDNQSASKKNYFVLSQLELPSNFEADNLFLDYEGAIHGFVIPSANQTDNGYFDFEFSVENKSDSAQSIFYKIFYQNESYKFQENDSDNKNMQSTYAHENFYGSWEDTEIGFKKTKVLQPGESIEIRDKFRIVGNPRNEEKYYWKGNNDRWKRNPRVGDYSALIVVANEQALKSFPEEVKYLHKINQENFINPYYYFLYGDAAKNKNVSTMLAERFINVKARPDLSKGIYVEKGNFNTISSQEFEDSFTDNCGNCEEIYENSTIAQFAHYIDESAKFYNIPLVRDIYEHLYTKEDYNWGRAFYSKEERIGILPTNPKYPCQNIKSEEGKITITNPKTEYGKWRKQNIGMITRHGFTYGKYTVKANLVRLLNDDNVWNGITNAIWLIYQGGSGCHETGWNLRRPCTKTGYMKTYWGGREDDRVERVAYSEIDFEILKTVHYCPSNKYPPVYENFKADPSNITAWNTPIPADVMEYDNKIAVCCTNWDMACHQPENFSAGCHEVTYENKSFLAHRWEDVYRAVTTKYMAPDSELFNSEYYYFQIDWQPDKIVWRIGPEKDKLFVVGYIDSTISMIPDNQMLLIITQEFHNINWWPGSPFMQHNIPFPGVDYNGYIYEIIVE